MKFAVHTAADAAAKGAQQEWGSMVWFASAPLGNAKGLTTGCVTLKPGCSNPRHIHPNCEEALYVLKGTLKHTIEDGFVMLHEGDTIVVQPHVVHHMINVGEEDAVAIVAFSAGERITQFVEE